MSIFDYLLGDKDQKNDNATFTEYEREINALIRKAHQEQRKLNDFLKSEGAKVYLQLLTERRDFYLGELRSLPSNERAIRVQERYATYQEMIDTMNQYVARVEST